jgi:hypothetical protein
VAAPVISRERVSAQVSAGDGVADDAKRSQPLAATPGRHIGPTDAHEPPDDPPSRSRGLGGAKGSTKTCRGHAAAQQWSSSRGGRTASTGRDGLGASSRPRPWTIYSGCRGELFTIWIELVLLFSITVAIGSVSVGALVAPGIILPSPGPWPHVWTDIVWKSGTPEQENGCDCGVFLVHRRLPRPRRPARLYAGGHMEHYRHRMVYQLIQQQMLP